MENELKTELKKWMKECLSPYCLNKCKNTCCECHNEECIYIDPGHEHLFKTYKLTGKKVAFSNKILKPNTPHLYKDKLGYWYFRGGVCPNYDSKNKKCLIYNQHPMCKLFPLEKTDEGYRFVSTCEICRLDKEEEPLKSLTLIFKRHKINLEI